MALCQIYLLVGETQTTCGGALMNHPKRYRIATVLWITAGLLLLFMTFLGHIPIPPKFFVLALLLAILLLFIFMIIGIGLAVCYCNIWKSWLPWPFLVLTLIITGTLSQQPVIIGPIDVQVIASLVFVSTISAFIIALGSMLFRYDVGLTVMAWLSLGGMWALVIWWQIGGNFLEPLLKAIVLGGESSKPIFWLAVFIITSLCLLPLALTSVVWHSVRLVRRELNKEPLPYNGMPPAIIRYNGSGGQL
jgi:hypothetical protein